MKFDLSAIEKAVGSLERALKRSQKEKKDEELRDAVIQRFEYTYELCWKMMKRRLEADASSPSAIDTLSFKDLLREAAEKGLIADVEAWFDYRDARNRTSHTYDEKNAEQVYKTAVLFFPAAKNLLEELRKRNR